MAGRKRKEIKMDYFSSYERECVCYDAGLYNNFQ